MQASVQTTLTDMRDIAVFDEEKPGRFEITSEVTRSRESDCDDLCED